jgi:hypothetical protein
VGRVKDVLFDFAELFSHPSERDAFLDTLSAGDLRGPSIEEPITFADVYDCWVDTNTIPQNLTLEAMCLILETETCK